MQAPDVVDHYFYLRQLLRRSMFQILFKYFPGSKFSGHCIFDLKIMILIRSIKKTKSEPDSFQSVSERPIIEPNFCTR